MAVPAPPAPEALRDVISPWNVQRCEGEGTGTEFSWGEVQRQAGFAARWSGFKQDQESFWNVLALLEKELSTAQSRSQSFLLLIGSFHPKIGGV